jgi:hypothetical protein
MNQAQVLDREEVRENGLELVDEEALFALPESVMLGPAPLDPPVEAVAPATVAPPGQREEQALWVPFPLFSLWLAIAFIAVVPMLALLGAAIWLSAGG